MTRARKPGDVAMVRNEHGVWNLAVCSVKPIGLVWQYGVADSQMPLNADARPLVVIDPEDREAVASLMRLYYRDINGQPVPASAELVVSMQAALRTFSDPTPAEPIGLGAVVEDAHGHRFVRGDLPDTDYRWRSRDAWQRWAEIDVARVLSEGVAP